MLQWYAKVPGVEKVWLYDEPDAMQWAGGQRPFPESKAPLSDVTLCSVWSWLVQVTVVPAVTVTVAGWKLKSWIETAVVAAAAGDAGQTAAVPTTTTDSTNRSDLGMPIPTTDAVAGM